MTHAPEPSACSDQVEIGSVGPGSAPAQSRPASCPPDLPLPYMGRKAARIRAAEPSEEGGAGPAEASATTAKPPMPDDRSRASRSASSSGITAISLLEGDYPHP